MSEIQSAADLDAVGRLIVQAFLEDDNHMHTIGGVVRQTGLDGEQVETFIHKHTELFRRSDLTPSGTHIFVYRPRSEQLRTEIESLDYRSV